jgi:hypothetical protein
VAIIDVTGDVERHGKSRCAETHDKETGEVDFVEILRIKEQVGDAEIFPEASGDHCKKDDPAEQQHMITLYVVQEQLNRKRIGYNGKKRLDPAH